MNEVHRKVLDNGLRLVHCFDDSTQMVALNILYEVGARDESPEHTGFAHLFEHLMFGGSIHIPSYDAPLQEAGGENNAWTSNDITNYYLTIPKHNVEIAFWLESDRMLQLAFNEESLEVQRQVVIEEFKQTHLNQPYGDIGHLVRDLAYKKHPYRWPTIGLDISHIEEATMEQVKDFYNTYYQPSNAVLAVTGNISWEDAEALTEKWFAPIPNTPLPPRNRPVEPLQTEERRLTVERQVPLDTLYMAFHMCDRFHPDYCVYDMISDVLSLGTSSRFNQRLVKERRIFSTLDAHISGSLDIGLFHIIGRPAEGITLEAAEAAVWEELEKLHTELVAQSEIEKLHTRFEASFVFGHISYLQQATSLSLHELYGPEFTLDTEVDRYNAVTAEDIRRVSKQCFQREHANVLFYKKK